MSPKPLSGRGVRFCRACGSDPLASVLDLGAQPLANELVSVPNVPDATFPLHLRTCLQCGLGQVGEFVLPERLFTDYPYLSSVSTSWVAHAKSYATTMTKELALDGEHGVVEIASNDGYLLGQFRALGVRVLGVEPAQKAAALAEAQGVPTIRRFLGRNTARQVVEDFGSPRLVVANNVLAHVPDLDDFIGGVSLLCDTSTVVTVENPSYTTLLREGQFDTVYHEHYSYLSAHAVSRLAARHGLDVVKVEDLPTHGGSYRYWLAREGARKADRSVKVAIGRELEAGLLSPQVWNEFADRSRRTVRALRRWLDQKRSRGARVAGYGAAAKGNTLLNAAHATVSDLVGVADASPAKQGRWLPGSRIPVITPAALEELAPSDVLVLPWNLGEEIVPLVGRLAPDALCWSAIPTMRRLDP